MNLNQQFVDYQTAVILKDLGFHEDCFNKYEIEKGELDDGVGEYSIQGLVTILAPLWQQAEAWLYTTKNIYIHVGTHNGRFMAEIVECGSRRVIDSNSFPTPLHARTSGMQEAVKYLHSKIIKK